jgi:hypothetical protein
LTVIFKRIIGRIVDYLIDIKEETDKFLKDDELVTNFDMNSANLLDEEIKNIRSIIEHNSPCLKIFLVNYNRYLEKIKKIKETSKKTFIDDSTNLLFYTINDLCKEYIDLYSKWRDLIMGVIPIYHDLLTTLRNDENLISTIY